MSKGGPLAIPAATSDEAVCFTAEDAGVGIRADIKDALFSPLFTNKARATGLSLAVCKRIIELHDGAIVLERDK
jgi:signal transduction histidine kinase